MNIDTYRQKRKELEEQSEKFRQVCLACRQPQFNCFCSQVKSFDPQMKFVILIHPLEVRRRVATGRMSHLLLQNSELIMGHNYTGNHRIQTLLNDPQYDPFALYPGRASRNITPMTSEGRREIFAQDKTPLIFVIDGTWNTAKKMLRLSTNLCGLPQISFTPPGLSQFRIRKQPKPGFYSTIEAIHHTVDLLGPSFGVDMVARPHDRLLQVFDSFVEAQLKFVRLGRSRHSKDVAKKSA